jgi:hypothetical protein
MSRLTAIWFLCLALAAPALATEEVGAPADQSVDPAESEIELDLDLVPDLEDLPPEVLEKLDADQIADILAAREETKQLAEIFGAGGDGRLALGNFGGGGAATLVPLGFFLTILLCLTAALVFRHRKHGQLQETLRLMIEKGAEIPPELIAPPDPPLRDLRRGVILLGVGLAVAIFLGLENGFAEGEWALGLIPGFIGAGYLLIWRISRRAESD